MTDEVDDIFGDFSLPDQDIEEAPLTPQGGQSSAPGSGQQPVYSTRTAVKSGYDPTPDVTYELAQLDQELEQTRPRMNQSYRPPPRGRGEIVASIAGPIGIASAAISLFFIGSWIAGLSVEPMMTVAALTCLFGLPLGALLSVTAITLAIIALVLGAGSRKSKAIFAIVFAILYWVMLVAYFMVAVIVFSQPA